MNSSCCKNLLELSLGDTQLLVLPLFHSFGQVVQLNCGFFSGNTLVLIARFDAEEVITALINHKVTVFCGVPTMYWALNSLAMAKPEIVTSIAKHLRLGVSGGAAIPKEIITRFTELFKVTILEGYGLSETSPVATFNLREYAKIGSVGLPIWGVEVDIRDQNDKPVATNEVGEIVIRGHNIMKGYFGKEAATKEAMRGGWFHSGDLGRKDEDGFIFIVDRLKDMIIRGGFNVYPRELEEVLLTHPDVSLAAVVGVPHAEYGEEIKAFVILKQGHSTIGDNIKEWMKREVANYKYPRIVEICEHLPMTATGKILKRELTNRSLKSGGARLG
jgi:long-chain acyl-CoA synthetase